jgi:hypothetical protein
MPLSDDRSIERLALGLIDRTLPKREWTHAGHFAAALWLLRHRRQLTAPREIRRLITRYNEATHVANTDTGGYHHTITLASMRAAAAHLGRFGSDVPLHAILDMLMASELGRHDWILAYWTHGTLFSVPARRSWIEPDRAPLPF